MLRIFWFAVAAVFIYLRFTLPAEGVIHKEDIFKDVAHMVVAGFLVLGALGVTKTDSNYVRIYNDYGKIKPVWTFLYNRNWYPLIIGIVMTVLEVVAFKLSQK